MFSELSHVNMVTRYTFTSTGHSESHEEVNNNQDVYKLSVKDAEEAKSQSSEIKDLTTVYELNKNFHIEINEQVTMVFLIWIKRFILWTS